MSARSNRYPFLGTLLTMVLVTVGCGDEPTATTDPAIRISLINATSGSNDLRLIADGTVALDQVASGTVSRSVPVAADITELRVRRQSGNGEIVVPISPVEGDHFVVTAMGDGETLVARALAVAVMPDTGQPVLGRANLRAVGLFDAPGGPEVDIHVTAPGVDLTGAVPTWQLSTTHNTYTGLKDFPPGDLQIRITTRGTTTVLAQSPPGLQVEADHIRVITLRHVGGGSLELVVAVEEPPLRTQS